MSETSDAFEKADRIIQGWQNAPDGTYCAMGQAPMDAKFYTWDGDKPVPVPEGRAPAMMHYQLPFPSDTWMEQSGLSLEEAIPVWLEAVERDTGVALESFFLSRRAGNDWQTMGRWSRSYGWMPVG